MRLAIVSDIHGNLVALEAVLADLAGRGCDAVLNLGDCVTSPLWPRETWERLAELRWPTVRGNHDRWLVEWPREKMSAEGASTVDALTAAQRHALASLPATIAGWDDVFGVHGRAGDDCEYLLENKVAGQFVLVSAGELSDRLGATAARLVCCGHSHVQRVTATADGRVAMNPGSVGCPRYEDFAGGGSAQARYAIATRRPAGWTVESLAVPYDWAAVTARAEANAQRAWADGFVGRV